jgi:glycosyltransferase involved in cell wall biosynthesis
MIKEKFDDSSLRIAYVSSYPPRECGIANFTKDLIDSIAELDGLRPWVIAINEKGAHYYYDRRVKRRVDRENIHSYRQAAEFVNSSNIDVVVIQHEFGLFGGDYGEYLKFFIDAVEKPIVTTLHTVQPNFDQKSLEILNYVSRRSKSVVVIARVAVDMLKKQGISCKKYKVIPHGCPPIELVDNSTIKESLGLEDRLVASTFGLISSGKGIEYAIQALSEVVKKEPNLIYLVIGETHPEVRRHEGEKYRNDLLKLVYELGLEDHVRFTNRFLSRRELIKYLQATDIYLTPYVSPNQISSGTLTYALGAGKAVVSTPYFHAQELLADGRGILCDFRDPASLALGISKLLDEDFRVRMQKKAHKYGKRFLWKNVAKEYMGLIKSVAKS